jgi:hypothetical protein
MATYTWRTGSGAFDNAGNWNPAVVPGSADTAVFNAFGGTITDAGSVAQLEFASAPWTIVGQLQTVTGNLLSGAACSRSPKPPRSARPR